MNSSYEKKYQGSSQFLSHPWVDEKQVNSM